MRKKTLFEEEVDDVFLRSLNKEKRPKTEAKNLEGYFYICSSSSKTTFYKYFFEMHDHYIFCKKSSSKNEIAFMDVKNSFLK